MFNRCPGQDNRKSKVVCPGRKYLIPKEKLPYCLDWCKAARERVEEQGIKS
jgi:hypothetical protein